MDIYLALIYFFCAFLNIILGIAVFVMNRKSKSNRYFLYFTLSQALWILSLFFLYYSIDPYNPLISNISVKAAYAFSLLMSASFTAFIYQFPRKTLKFSKNIKTAFILISTFIIAITVFTPLVYEEQIVINNTYQDDILGPLYFLYIIFLLTQLSTAIVIGINKAISLRGIDRKKVLLVLAGIGIFGVLSILVNVILPAFEIYIFYRNTIIFSLFFLIPTFYSFQKHRFFNISYLSLELLRNLILLTAFVVFVVTLNHSLMLLFPSLNHVIIFVISILSGLVIWTQFQKFFPQLVSADFAKFKKYILKLQAAIHLCSNFQELENLLEKYFILKQNISSLKIFVARNTKIDNHLPIYIKDKFTNHLEKFKNDILVKAELEYMKISPATKKFLLNKMDELDASIIMPLFAEHKLIGFFLLGNKEKNKLYTQEEINQIMRIKPQLEIALTNFLLKLNLQEENNLMKEIIEEKTKKLQEQFKEIKSLLEQQSDFIAVTAHEFRTPLSIAMFQLEDTLTTHEHTPQVVKDMEVMSESLNNLRHLTQTLFDVQQYDLNKIKLKKSKVDLNKYLNHIAKEFRLIMEEKNINFHYKNNIKKQINIDIDEQQIRQVFANLLNNAIKFADNDKPEISIEANGNENAVQIAVIDNGSGIQNKDKERVFEKFQTTKVSMGTGIGLGLYICKKIIELHKGKIWIEDNQPKGTKFIFELRK